MTLVSYELTDSRHVKCANLLKSSATDAKYTASVRNDKRYTKMLGSVTQRHRKIAIGILIINESDVKFAI